ncbi:MAG: hypothetical protein AAB229_08855 [Candidatus Hydrogenedentota bacterium]
MKRVHSLPALLAAIWLVAAWAGPVSACAVCYGDPSSSAVQSVNMGVMFMVGVVGMVLAGFVAAFIVYSRNIERKLAQACLAQSYPAHAGPEEEQRS